MNIDSVKSVCIDGTDARFYREEYRTNEICSGCAGHGCKHQNDPRKVVLRVSRHPLDETRMARFREQFGDDVIVATEDISYGDDPVATVKKLIGRAEAICSQSGQTVAVEAAGPEAVLMALVQSLGVPVIRPVFRRDGDRVAVVGRDANGRDMFEVERYEALTIEQRPALVGKQL